MNKETIICIIAVLTFFVGIASWLIAKEQFFDYIGWYCSELRPLFAICGFFFVVAFWLFAHHKPKDRIVWVAILSSILSFLLIAFLPLFFFLPQPEVTVRIKGSTTIGAEYMPLLVSTYAREHGANKIKTEVAIESKGDILTTVSANFKEGFIEKDLKLNPGTQKLHSIQFEIEAKGTPYGFDDLRARTFEGSHSSEHAHLWMASSHLEESPDYKDLSSKVQTAVFANDGISVIAHYSQPIDTLTIEQIRNTFNGTQKVWKELGSNTSEKIEVCIRKDSGTTREFEKLLGLEEKTLDKIELSALNFKECNSNEGMIKYVSEQSFRLGYAPYLLATREKQVKILGIKRDSNSPRIVPTISNILNGTYPLRRELYLYSLKAGTSNEDIIAKDIAASALKDEGQAIADKAGLVPLKIPNQNTPSQDCPAVAAAQSLSPPIVLPEYDPRLRPVFEIKFEYANPRLSENEKARLTNWGEAICHSQRSYVAYGFTDSSGGGRLQLYLGAFAIQLCN